MYDVGERRREERGGRVGKEGGGRGRRGGKGSKEGGGGGGGHQMTRERERSRKVRILGKLQNRIENSYPLLKLTNPSQLMLVCPAANVLHAVTHLVDAEPNAKVSHSHLPLSPAVLLHEGHQDRALAITVGILLKVNHILGVVSESVFVVTATACIHTRCP